MKKVAIAVMLLATSAFAGAISVTPTNPVIDANGNVTLSVDLVDMVDGQRSSGFSLFALATPGELQVAGREFTNTFFPTATIPNPIGLILEDTGMYDLGAVKTATGPDMTENGQLLILTLKTLRPVSADDPIVVDLIGMPTIDDVAQENWNTITITPEPASMLLLAAGSLLFARRRRA